LGQTGQRRSERVLMDLPIIVSGESTDHGTFLEETFTVTVSAHGALMMLATQVAIGQKLLLTNPANHGQREARVAYLGHPHAGLSQVGVEFARPSPEFWPINSPPQDWKVC
jgi:hypothetical protein